MDWVEWTKRSVTWCERDKERSPLESRILFTRFLRRRNFEEFPFWVSASPEFCSRLSQKAKWIAESLGFKQEWVLSETDPQTLGLFRERQYLPERPISFPGKREFKRMFLSEDPTECVWLGEVEHWTQIQCQPNLPSEIIPQKNQTTNNIFSHSESIGYLTSNPAYAGCGLQLEVGLHLPALTASRRASQIGQALLAMGLELQPLSLRMPGSAEAGFFRLSTRGGMNFNEESLYLRFKNQLKSVLIAEEKTLESWKERENNRMEDRVFRSLRLLQEARTLDYPEFLTFVSFSRLGAYLSHFEASLLPILEELRVRTQTFHIMANLSSNASDSDADIFRANVVRSALQVLGMQA